MDSDERSTVGTVTGVVVSSDPGAVGARLGAIALLVAVGGYWLVSRTAPPAAAPLPSAGNDATRVARDEHDGQPTRAAFDPEAKWNEDIDVVPGALRVRGGLPKDIVRRIVRRHLNELRFCYAKALTKNPTVAGRIDVQFAISAAGAITAAIVTRSTTYDQKLDGCVASAVRRWEFPKPAHGGIVVATYPFVLAVRLEK